MSHKGEETQWISFSDMMTSLMMVFLFVSVAYMFLIQKEIVGYQDKKNALYKELSNEFKNDFEPWGMELDSDLTIKFKDPNVLFEEHSPTITPQFDAILQQFIPRYLSIVASDQYTDVISEVRIEGHTAVDPNYLYTIDLSQRRSNAVLAKILAHSAYADLSPDVQKRVQFWFTSNGLGNGRMLDEDGIYVIDSGNEPSKISRRVEFKIVTRSADALDRLDEVNSRL